MTTALEMRRRSWEVDLVDPGPLPREAAASTDISKIVRLDYGSDETYLSIMEDALERWRGWNARWGETLFHEDGFLVLTGGPMRPGGFEYESLALLRKHGHPAERIDAPLLAERFPAWRAGRYGDGYLNPQGGWAESGKVVARLIGETRDAGVRVHEGEAFSRLHERGSRIVGIETVSGELLRGDLVLMATGAWMPTIIPGLDDLLWAVAQPVFHFRAPDVDQFRPPAFVPWAADIARSGWYGFPALADGTLKIANHGPGRRVHPDEPRATSPDDEGRFREFLREALPALADAPVIASRLCLYCDSWDGNFWIDHHPSLEGLAVAAGDSGHAFKFAPVLGGMIADVLERKPNRYAQRFAWRSRGTQATEEARFGGDRRGR